MRLLIMILSVLVMIFALMVMSMATAEAHDRRFLRCPAHSGDFCDPPAPLPEQLELQETGVWRWSYKQAAGAPSLLGPVQQGLEEWAAVTGIRLVQEEGSRVLNIGMHNMKNNDDELMRPFGLTVAFDGRRGPISVTRNDINEVPDLAQGLSLKSRLLYSLKSGPRQLDDLAEELFPDAVDKKDLDRARTQVRARLNDLAKSGSAQKWVAGKWTLTSDREEESS